MPKPGAAKQKKAQNVLCPKTAFHLGRWYQWNFILKTTTNNCTKQSSLSMVLLSWEKKLTCQLDGWLTLEEMESIEDERLRKEAQ